MFQMRLKKIDLLCLITLFVNIYVTRGDEDEPEEDHTIMDKEDHRRLDQRVHMGERAKEGEFKFVVGMTVTDTVASVTKGKHTLTHICTGSIISPRFVLTAAHCIDCVVAYCLVKSIEGAKAKGYSFSRVQFNIYAGTTDIYMVNANHLQKMTVSHPSGVTMHIHPEPFTFIPIRGDLGLKCEAKRDFLVLELLKKKFVFNDYVQPVPLLKNPIPNMVEDVCKGMGFGRQNDVLYEHDLKLYWIFLDVGGAKYCDMLRDARYYKNHHVCALGKGMRDTCAGDSGGPLVCGIPESYYQVGVLSLGSPKGRNKLKGCGQWNTSFGVYGYSGVIEDWLVSVDPEVKFLTHQEAVKMQNIKRTIPVGSSTSLPVPGTTDYDHGPKPGPEPTGGSTTASGPGVITEPVAIPKQPEGGGNKVDVHKNNPEHKINSKHSMRAKAYASSLHSSTFCLMPVKIVLLLIAICNSWRYK